MAKNDDAPPVIWRPCRTEVPVLEHGPRRARKRTKSRSCSTANARGWPHGWPTRSGGAAEYLPADALVAGYVSTREPWQLFQELRAFHDEENESFAPTLAEANAKLGEASSKPDGSDGDRSAFALNGFSVEGRSGCWPVAGQRLVGPSDNSLRKLADAFNAELSARSKSIGSSLGRRARRAHLDDDERRRSVWVTWTYDQGYLCCLDRGPLKRAIATGTAARRCLGRTRSGAAALIGRMHPSAFAWLNTKGPLGSSRRWPNPALTKLLGERERCSWSWTAGDRSTRPAVLV